MSDPEVKGPPQDGPGVVERPGGPEILPEPKRDGWQQQPAPPAPAVHHGVVALTVREPGHIRPSSLWLRLALVAARTYSGPLHLSPAKS